MKNKLVLFAMAFAVCILTGCAPSHQWVPRIEPTTDAERNAIAAHVQKILAGTPATLSGHDQDWDDAIKEAHRQATILFCRQTLWEWETGLSPHYTGRWRYADEKPTINP